MKRIWINTNNILIIADSSNVSDDVRNPISNIYTEINGTIYAFYKKSVDELILTIDYSDILDINGVAYTSQTVFTDLIEGSGSKIDVVLQDSTAPLMVVKASNLITETTLTTQTAKNDYIINVADATSFIIGGYLTIYSVDANRVFFSEILFVDGLSITLDSPLDFEFLVGSFVSVGSINMNVDGSVTPQIFGLRNPTGLDVPLKFDITRLMFKCLTDGSNDLSKFGDITGGLLRGVVIRRVDGVYRNIFNAKTNGELKSLMYDFQIQEVKGSQQDGFTGRLTFAGQNKMGAVIRIGADEDLQIVIQDDLTSLNRFIIIAEGSEVI